MSRSHQKALNQGLQWAEDFFPSFIYDFIEQVDLWMTGISNFPKVT